MNSRECKQLIEAYSKVYNESETSDDLFDEVLHYLLGEGYSTQESIQIMIALAEQGAVQGSLFTSKGTLQKFASKTGKPLTPFIKTEPVPTRSRVQATPPRTPASVSRQSPGQLSIPKPAAKPTQASASSAGRSQQFRDVQRLTGRTGGGVMGTTKPTNLEPRAPKPAWKPTTTAATKPVAKPATTSSAAKPNPYRPGATVRATGPNMDKFPQLQRFANQAANVAKPVSNAAATIKALASGSRLGIAGAVMAPRPTGDATLKGALKRGDYKPKQGPTNPDQGLTKAQSFDKAFKAARTSGSKQFTWNNKTYNTKVK